MSRLALKFAQAPAVIRSEKDTTPRDRVRRVIAPGRARGRLPGGHVTDMATLGKAIALCGGRTPKFDPARYGYVTKRNIPFVCGRCDGCDQRTERARLFLKHGTPGLTWS